jgi:hypothetical protein
MHGLIRGSSAQSYLEDVEKRSEKDVTPEKQIQRPGQAGLGGGRTRCGISVTAATTGGGRRFGGGGGGGGNALLLPLARQAGHDALCLCVVARVASHSDMLRVGTLVVFAVATERLRRKRIL